MAMGRATLGNGISWLGPRIGPFIRWQGWGLSIVGVGDLSLLAQPLLSL